MSNYQVQVDLLLLGGLPTSPVHTVLFTTTHMRFGLGCIGSKTVAVDSSF